MATSNNFISIAFTKLTKLIDNTGIFRNFVLGNLHNYSIL